MGIEIVVPAVSQEDLMERDIIALDIVQQRGLFPMADLNKRYLLTTVTRSTKGVLFMR